MEPLSTRAALHSDSGDPFRGYHGVEYQVGPSSGRVHLGDTVHYHNVYSTPREAEGSDTDTESFEGMPEGWDAAQSPENDTYYVRPINPESGTRATTWIKPMLGWATADMSFREELTKTFREALQPEFERMDGENVDGTSPTNPGQDYYAEIEASATRLGHWWPLKREMFPPPSTGIGRCSIYTEGIAVLVDEKIPSRAVETLVHALKEKKDSICIIENVNGDWMQALGATPELDIPTEFFARQASSHTEYSVRQGPYIPAMDDIVERALPLGRRILRKKREDSIKKIINTLCEASVVVKTSVDNWMLYGVTSHEIDRAASCVAECTSVLNKLKETATSVGRSADSNSPKSDPISARALHRQMADLEFLRLRRFYNLYANYEFEEHIPSNKHLKSITSSYFTRSTRRVPSFAPTKSQHDTGLAPGRYISATQISYIRVDKTLCKQFTTGTPDRY